MAIIHDLRKFVLDEKGEVVLRTYAIPFRPEYLLIEGPVPGTLVPASAPTGRDVKQFRFGLSEEAVALIVAVDPNVHPRAGFSKIVVEFDSRTNDVAWIKATCGVREGAPSRP